MRQTTCARLLIATLVLLAGAGAASAQTKKETHETESGLPVHSFGSLLAHLATRVRNTHQIVSDPSGATFQQLTEPDALQAEALRLVTL